MNQSETTAPVPCASDFDSQNMELVKVFHQKAFDGCVPISATLELSLRCNLKCIHCYNFDRQHDLPPVTTNQELPTERILKLLEELREAGTLYLAFTGGEALIHPNLFEFLDKAHDLRFAISILTNGLPLTQNLVSKLTKYTTLSGISISLYGATAKTHDEITTVPGSWRKTISGIIRLRNAGIPYKPKFILMAQNAHEIEQMQGIAKRFNAPFQADATITARNDGSCSSLTTRMSLDQLTKAYQGPLKLFVPEGGQIPGAITPCACARSNCAITASGEIQPCIAVPLSCGNIRDRTFSDVWNSSPVLNMIRNVQHDDFKHCRDCEDRAYCRRSAGAAVTATGDFTGIDPWVCGEAKILHQLADEKTESIEV